MMAVWGLVSVYPEVLKDFCDGGRIYDGMKFVLGYGCDIISFGVFFRG